MNDAANQDAEMRFIYYKTQNNEYWVEVNAQIPSGSKLIGILAFDNRNIFEWDEWIEINFGLLFFELSVYFGKSKNEQNL
jgi:hypothetical protein